MSVFFAFIGRGLLGVALAIVLDVRPHWGREFSVKKWWAENAHRLAFTGVMLLLSAVIILAVPEAGKWLGNTFGLAVDGSSPLGSFVIGFFAHSGSVLSLRKVK